jgi:hypothetical protein
MFGFLLREANHPWWGNLRASLLTVGPAWSYEESYQERRPHAGEFISSMGNIFPPGAAEYPVLLKPAAYTMVLVLVCTVSKV